MAALFGVFPSPFELPGLVFVNFLDLLGLSRQLRGSRWELHGDETKAFLEMQ